VALSSQPAPPRKVRLLLDQGFPNPPGFTVNAIDRTVEVVNLRSFDQTLAENSTPDWVLYCVAAAADFDALVTRDQAQLHQLVEMYVLSRLRSFTVITWKKPIEDPVREWGQLLAYLPEVKKRLQGTAGQAEPPEAILLPAPTLSAGNIVRAADGVGVDARKRGVSHQQAHDEALAEIRDWLEMMSRDPHEFDDVLGFGSTL
jgi:hypothetical protein